MIHPFRARRLAWRAAHEAAALARLLDGSARHAADFARLDRAFREVAGRGQTDPESLDRAARRFTACLVHLSPRHAAQESGKAGLAADIRRIAARELTDLWQPTA